MRASWDDIERLRTSIGTRPVEFDELLAAWPVPGLARTIVERYQEAPRCYHDLRHIRENWRIVLEEGWFDAFADRQIELFATNAFHDIVYVQGATDNERRSADEFASLHPADGAGGAWSRDVHRTIVATNDHLSPVNADLPEWGRLFLDVDLFHLASDPSVYEEMGRRLLTELSSRYDHEAILAGRLGWLRKMIEKPRIYWIMEDREEGARRNLKADEAKLLRHGVDALLGRTQDASAGPGFR